MIEQAGKVKLLEPIATTAKVVFGSSLRIPGEFLFFECNENLIEIELATELDQTISKIRSFKT